MTRQTAAINVGPGHDRLAPDDGTDVAELMRMTGWKRTRLYRHRRQYAGAGRAIGVSGGHWPARRHGERSP